MTASNRPFVACAIFVLLSSAASVHDEHFLFLGDSSEEHLGRGMSDAGDVDGDGFDDIVVGMHRNATAGLNAGRARVYSGLTGRVLWEWFGDAAGDRFGVSVAGVGDVDGDGLADILVGAHQPGVGNGYARLFSGSTGLEIRTLVGESFGDTFGEWVAAGGDATGDGTGDLIIGADDYDSDRGAAYVFDGATGALVRAYYGDSAGDSFGVTASSVGDVDHDGYADLIVGAYLDDDNGLESGTATVYSGDSGSVLFVKHGVSAGDRFGISVAAAGDVDNDGTPDFIVGAATADGAGQNSGGATVYSGLDGALLHHFDGTAGSSLGISVAPAGDLDDDGFDDVFVGAYRDDTAGLDAGRVLAYSGFDGSVLLDVVGDVAGDSFGRHVRLLGDVNGDQVPDFAASAPDSSQGQPGSGKVWVLSVDPLALASDRHEVSLLGGGAQTLDISAGSANGGQIYWVLGSFTGVTPPFMPNGVPLPLVIDSFTVFTVKFANSAVLSGSAGLLDANGDATMTFNIPPASDPALEGLTLFWAYYVYDLQFHPTMSSNPIPVTLIP